jgi:hypothetical protein
MEANKEVSEEVKHTLLPWHTIEYAGFHDITTEPYYGENSVLNIEHCEEAEANAAFIVKACNSYYQLKSETTSLREENDNLRKIIHDSGNEYQARMDQQLQSIMKDANVKINELQGALEDIRDNCYNIKPGEIKYKAESALQSGDKEKV